MRDMSLAERKAKLPKARLITDESELSTKDKNWVDSCVNNFVEKVQRAEKATDHAYKIFQGTDTE